MMNKDYILRMAERFGRALAIILQLRQSNKYEEALIAIDDMFLHTVGYTSSFINSASEEMLLNLLSPLGVLNVEKCLWIAGNPLGSQTNRLPKRGRKNSFRKRREKLRASSNRK